MCQLCANQIAPKHLHSLLNLLEHMDRYNVDNDAVIGLLRGKSNSFSLSVESMLNDYEL
jgi:hypothetical protein